MTDRDNTIPDDADIHDAARRSRTIYDKATRNFQIVHTALLLFATTTLVTQPTEPCRSSATRHTAPSDTRLKLTPDCITAHRH